MYDPDLAALLGTSADAVYRERTRRGIPAFAHGGRKKEGSEARTIRMSLTAWAAYDALGGRDGAELALIAAAARLKTAKK
jgi:hypothetical protein